MPQLETDATEQPENPATNQESPEKDIQLADNTAQAIGNPDINPGNVSALIEKLRKGQFMMHGIKEAGLVPSVMSTGVGNLTPEGGNISCWCTGSSGFGEILKSGKHETYGCTFFHYAHSYTPDSPTSSMTIALTNLATLEQHGIPAHKYFRENSEISIPFPIPRSAIHIVKIEIPRDQATWATNPRAIGQAAEAVLFKKIEEVLPKFTPGGLN